MKHRTMLTFFLVGRGDEGGHGKNTFSQVREGGQEGHTFFGGVSPMWVSTYIYE
jgi:hypothetical protein